MGSHVPLQGEGSRLDVDLYLDKVSGEGRALHVLRELRLRPGSFADRIQTGVADQGRNLDRFPRLVRHTVPLYRKVARSAPEPHRRELEDPLPDLHSGFTHREPRVGRGPTSRFPHRVRTRPSVTPYDLDII